MELDEDQKQIQDISEYRSLDQKAITNQQIINSISFILTMVVNGIAPFISAKSLGQITKETNVRIQPAGYAFAIWGIIYTLVAIHVVYQALPQSWIDQYPCLGKRNNQLQYQDLKILFPLNMGFNALWLPVFETDCSVGFFFGIVLIIGILTTCVMIMMISVRRSLNIYEIIGLRIGFSIYSGWVTAATILNITIFLKSVGIKEPQYQEEIYGVVMLYVAEVVYLVITVHENNVVYGLVYIWVLAAIRAKQQGYQLIQNTTQILLVIHSVVLVFWLVKMLYFKFWKKVKQHGLLNGSD